MELASLKTNRCRYYMIQPAFDARLRQFSSSPCEALHPADQVGIAIALHTENRHNLLSQDYRDVVNEMYESADNLYSNVDAITDYEKALDKADKARVLTLPDDV